MYFRQHLERVLHHKRHVFWECWRAGIPLQGLFHDLSKFCQDEFIPYANWFGSCGDSDYKDDFKQACLLHNERNAHHWEFWTNNRKDIPQEYECTIPEMDQASRLEMVCDWRAFACQHGHVDTAEEYYLRNKSRIKLNPVTREWVEQELGITREGTE